MVVDGGECVHRSIPVAVPCKAFFCDQLICVIADSDSAAGRIFFRWCVDSCFCDELITRSKIPTGMCVCVCVCVYVCGYLSVRDCHGMCCMLCGK